MAAASPHKVQLYYMEAIMMIPSCIASVWLLGHLLRLGHRHRKICIAQQIMHLALTNVALCCLVFTRNVAALFWDCHCLFPYFHPSDIWVAQCVFDTAIAVSFLCAVQRRSHPILVKRLILFGTWFSPILAWAACIACAVLKDLAVRHDKAISLNGIMLPSSSLVKFYQDIIFCASFVATVSAYFCAHFLSRPDIAQAAVIRRVTALYLLKTFVIDGIYAVTLPEQPWNGSTWISYVGIACQCVRGVFDALCYASSTRLAFGWLTQKLTFQRSISQDAGEISDVLVLRLDIFSTLRDFSLDTQSVDPVCQFDPSYDRSASFVFQSTVCQFDPSVIDPVRQSMEAPSQIDLEHSWDSVNYRRDAMSQTQQESVIKSARAVEDHFLQEICICHSAEMLGIVVNMVADLQLGATADEALRQAWRRVEEQHRVLQESLKIRLDARVGKSLSGSSSAAFWRTVEEHHTEAISIVEPMLVDLHMKGVTLAYHVKGVALALLQKKQQELDAVSSVKYDTMEALLCQGESLSDLHAEEEAFADIAVQVANANPESKMSQRLALRAIARATQISSSVSGKEGLEHVKERWRVFAQATA